MVFSELIAVYLFLGGAAAGSFLCIALIEVREDITCAVSCGSLASAMRVQCRNSLYLTRRRVARLVYAMSFVLLACGLGCLLADLGKPQVFYYLFLYPTTSLVSLGSFALMGFFVCMVISVADAVLEKSVVFKRVALIAKVVGIPLAVFVMMYTGLLLKTVIPVYIWQSYWLVALFTLSALSCGCGVVILCAFFSEGYKGIARWSRFFSIADIVCIVLEAVVAVVYFWTIYNNYGLDPLIPVMFSDLSYMYWLGFVGCGLVVPLGLEIYALLMNHHMNRGVLVLLSVMILLGGLCLRLTLVSAGIHYMC